MSDCLIDITGLIASNPMLKDISDAKEIVWINDDYGKEEKSAFQDLKISDIDDAEARLKRFAPFIMKCFPETKEKDGIIESELREIPLMKESICRKYALNCPGRLFLKMDSNLAIAGSIKARGGIYEVIKHTEDLALSHGLISLTDDYSLLASDECKKFFQEYTMQVGSTGNLGLSIGIMSAVIGYKAVVHMSSDAKEWKKELLRSYGVIVKEYDSDYSEAVKCGRAMSDADPNSYFVDDENSIDLFLGYAVAAKRLKAQLDYQGILVDDEHPLFVYLPCGVGGAPGGVTFGLKEVFGDSVHCFFVEPTEAPCMALGMITGLNNKICVQDFGLSGITEADGLAVGRASGFVGSVMKYKLSGEMTLSDDRLFLFLRLLYDSEGIFIEPSSCAAFAGPIKTAESNEIREYISKHKVAEENIIHICWATGGRLVPDEIRKQYLS